MSLIMWVAQKGTYGMQYQTFARALVARTVFGRAAPALVDKDGNRIETEEGITIRWVENCSSIEAGSVFTAEHIVDTVIDAESRKAELLVIGRLVDMAKHQGFFPGHQNQSRIQHLHRVPKD